MKKAASPNGFFLYIILIVLSMPQIVFSWPIPDTGQTKCYNNTAEISCPQPGEAFYGQDGNYNINPPSYTKLDASGNALPDAATPWAMIKDNGTGVIWENKTDDGSIHDKDNTYTWCDNNSATNGGNAGTCGNGTDTEDFIKALNDANFGGFTDWRLPTHLELKTIVNSGRYNPTITETYFPETKASYHWSSSTIAADPTAAWYIDFELGDDNKDSPSGIKNNAHFVRAVRGVKFESRGSLIDNLDGTITDARTGLMWQKYADTNVSTWQDSLSYSESLILAGYDDWRLPTQTEMHSLIDRTRYNPAAYIKEFPDTLSHSAYRTSTSNVKWPDFVSGVHFYHGSDYGSKKTDPSSKRAVRGGQNILPGHIVILSPDQADKWPIGSQMVIIWSTQDISGNLKISLSRQGGKSGTFTETIAESVSNNGTYTWTVTGPASVNCVLKIEPLSDSSKSTTLGLFTIQTKQFNLTVSKSGNGDGSITSDPPGIDCGNDCVESIPFSIPLLPV